uniref:Very-long-chain (3R)-3-hydroxyacyl-CoA dehydratase n=1 Tax=Oryza punctata TaxID=4537 RepID=A0A0E0JE33_ORYPU
MALLVAQILHGLVGLVRSPVSATLPQIGSRLFLTWGILWSFPETHSHILVTSLVISWSITEIVRYSFFGMKEAFGFAPSWLLWLRYSTFMVLYPTGISSEVGLIYIALPYMKASEKYCLRMPNKWNFSFDFFYASILSLAVYVPVRGHVVLEQVVALHDGFESIGSEAQRVARMGAVQDRGRDADADLVSWSKPLAMTLKPNPSARRLPPSSRSSAMAADGSVLRRLYLSVYNWVVFIGWSLLASFFAGISWIGQSRAQVSLSMILALLGDGHDAVYAAIERHLLFAQTAAIMEILHSILGLVRSPMSSTLPQITGRLFITWGILWSFPETHSYILVTPLIVSWSITEVIRYSFFGIKESFGFTPSWLLWLRYSTFIVCYPVGMVSEVGLIYIAFPFMKASEKYCIRVPNKWNFSFDYFYFSAFFMALYVPVFPYLLLHMVAQRKKALSKAKTA